MLIVAERVNASRKAIRAALEKLDAAAIANEVRIQADAGAHYIDVNGGTFPGREAELLCWLVDTAQEVTELPLCLDSPDPDALAAALARVNGARPMINSINLEPERFARVLPLARERDQLGAVLARKRQHARETLGLQVDGIDHRPRTLDPRERRGERVGIRTVQAQRQLGRALGRVHEPT